MPTTPTPAARPAPPRRTPLEITVDRIWRFFTSVRNAVIEIVWLTLLTLIGTLRGSEVPEWIANLVPPLRWLVDRWYAWDVFGSWIYAATLALIAVAIIICTLNRVPSIWATIAQPTITTSAGFLKSAETNAAYQLSQSVTETTDSLTASLRKHRYRVLSQTVGDATHVYADKNRWGNLGTFPFHLGLILVLVGGIVASVYGFRDDEFVIPEGARRNVGHGTDLAVELVRFRDAWNADGQPQDYRSSVAIYEDGKEIKTGDITVNHPLSAGQATFYQASFGNAAQFEIVDQGGNMIWSDAVELGLFNQSANPDAPAGVVRIPQAGIQMVVIAPDGDPANAPQLDTLKLETGQMFVIITPLDGAPAPEANDQNGAGGVRLNQGEPQEIDGYRVTFKREMRFSVLQVGYNPGIPIFVVAAIAMVGGVTATFALPHRRIRAIIAPAADGVGSVATLAPLARRDWGGKHEFFRIVQHLSTRLDTTPEMKLPSNMTDYVTLAQNEAW